MNKTIIPVAEFDGHDCKLGPEGGCGVCQARAEFYRVSRQKWQRLQQKWALIRARSARRYMPDAMMVSAIMTDHNKEAVWNR